MATHRVREGTRCGCAAACRVWQAVGLSVALMAPSMAANINPQGTAGSSAARCRSRSCSPRSACCSIAYGFVRLCQYYQHAGSVYAFVGRDPRRRAPAPSPGSALFGTYVFYGVVTSSASGIFGAGVPRRGRDLDTTSRRGRGSWSAAVALLLALLLDHRARASAARRRCSSIEGVTVALILVVAAVVLVRAGRPATRRRRTQHFTLDVFKVAPGTEHARRCSSASSSASCPSPASRRRRRSARRPQHPRRDIPRAILGTAIFGGIYFTVVTAIEMMGFGTGRRRASRRSSTPASLMGDLGTSYIGVLGRRPGHPRRGDQRVRRAAWPAWSARRGCCSR